MFNSNHWLFFTGLLIAKIVRLDAVWTSFHLSSFSQVDTPSCSARELALAAARLEAHLYWSISSRLDEEKWEGPNLTEQSRNPTDSESVSGKEGGGPTFIVGGVTETQDQSVVGEQNGSVTTDQSESEA